MEIIVLALIGVAFVLMGITNFKGNLSMLHSYHVKRVTEENRLPFGRLVGLGIIIIGVSMIIAALSRLLANVLQKNVFYLAADIIIIVGLVIGLGITFFAMFKYNKGIF